MPDQNGSHATQHVGSTILMVMMDVDPEDEEEFHRWYNQQHIPERLEIPGYVSTRRFKLESGDDGMLKYLCIWEMDDSSAMEHEMYKAQNADPTALYERVTKTVKARCAGGVPPDIPRLRGLRGQVRLPPQAPGDFGLKRPLCPRNPETPGCCP